MRHTIQIANKTREIVSDDTYLSQIGAVFEPRVLHGANALISRGRLMVSLELSHFGPNVMNRVSLSDLFAQLTSLFPASLVIDIDGSRAASLRDTGSACMTMYDYIVGFRFRSIVAGFSQQMVS